MVFFNYATMQMAAKIVYYGPGLCGKTTNLQHVYQKTSPKSRGEMVSLETETDRTLFFDLLPLDVGNIAGFKTRFQLYTVPGQVFYNSTRKLVLRGVDGVVFVADSQIPMMDANIESLNNLRSNLQELGLNQEEVPLVLQYNKRDLKNIATLEEMNRVLNTRGVPYFEASAVQGTGVFETLKGISKATLIALRKRALGEDKLRIPEIATRPVPKMATPPPVPVRPSTPVPPPAAVPPAPVSPPVFATPQPKQAQAEQITARAATPAPVLAAPTAAEMAKETVEFAELARPVHKPEIKKIAVKTSDIGLKLDSLRDLYTGKSYSVTKEKKGTTIDPLTALLETTKDKEKRIIKKLKIRLDPKEIDAIKNLSIDFHLSGGAIHKRFSNAMNVTVEGKTNPKRLTLEIKLEIVKK